MPDEAGVTQRASGTNIAQAAPGGTALVVSYQYVAPQPVDEVTLAAAQRRLTELPGTVPAPGTLPAGSRIPLRPNPLFVGRNDELFTLAATLTAGAPVVSGQTVALTGLGGVGKTQLACEFAHRYGRWFAGGVFWLSFENAAGVAAEVAACGGPGGLELRPDFASLSLEDRVRAVLAAWQNGLPRLLVFDNCEDEEPLAQWRPPTGGCCVLVTSRREEWSPQLGISPLRLGVLRRQEGVELLRQYRSDLPPDDVDLRAIAAELGDLPLALHLAGSFLARYRGVLGPATYLAQLRGPNPLAHRSLQGAGISPTGHGQNIARTFTISYQRLDPADPVDEHARSLLASAACLAPGENIPRDLLLATLDVDPDDADAVLRAEDALLRLVELGLLESHATGLRIHRLVAAFVRAQPGTDAARSAVEEVLAAAVEDEIGAGYRDQVTRSTLEAHLRAVTDAALPRADFAALRLSNALGNLLRRTVDTYPAVSYLEQALHIDVTLRGEDHPGIARSLNDLGYALMFKGDRAAARNYLEAALPRWQQMGDDANRAATLDNLGQLAERNGDYLEARRCYEEALHLRERVLGPDHPRTTISAHNLGMLLLREGDLEEGGRYLRRALESRLRMLGPDHMFTAIGLSEIGKLHLRRGEFAAAREHLERALPVYERVRGLTDSSTISLQHILLSIAQIQGDQVRAGELLQRLAEIRDRIDECRDSYSATDLNNLGYSLWTIGDYHGARGYYQNAIAIDEEARGPLDPALSTMLNNLGMIGEREADFAGAAAYYERALVIQEFAGRSRDVLTGRIRNNFGVALRFLGRLVEARAQLEEALAIRTEVLGAAHTETGVTMVNLGVVRDAQGDETEGLASMERGLANCRNGAGDTHPDVARCLHELGMVHLADGRFDRAEHALREALRIRQQILAPGHVDTADTLLGLGLLALRGGDRGAASSNLTDALAIYERRLGPENPRSRAVRAHLAAC